MRNLHSQVLAQPHFPSPPSGNTPLWRYMDLASLVSLLAKKALFFNRVDVLARNDPFEGRLGLANLTCTADRLRAAGIDLGRVDLITSRRRHSDVMSRNTAVICWYANETESMAMWRLYAASGQGVAIRSTFSRLLEAFVPPTTAPGNLYESVFVGTIKYLAHEQEEVIECNEFGRFMWKRRAFEHEREVRALFQVPAPPTSEDPQRCGLPDGGDYVEVHVDKLVEAIVLAPTASPWFMDVVQSLVARFGYPLGVEESSLAAAPLL